MVEVACIVNRIIYRQPKAFLVNGIRTVERFRDRDQLPVNTTFVSPFFQRSVSISQRRISRAVNLALRISQHRQQNRRDGQEVACIGDGV